MHKPFVLRLSKHERRRLIPGYSSLVSLKRLTTTVGPLFVGALKHVPNTLTPVSREN
jgi:hypothetical protein